MASAGIGSRRACEALIEEGRVSVNDRVVRRLPAMVTPGVDRITIDGEPLERYMPRSVRQAYGRSRETRSHPLVYVMLYKPGATLTTMDDPDQRRTVSDLVRHPSGIRLFPIGRLDYDTLGLLILTNDGELTNRLTHPRYEIHKTYRAVVKGAISPEQIEKLRAGTYLSDRRGGRTVGASRTKGVDLTIVRTEPQRTILDITLKEGRNRQVRRMLADVGCPVRKLVRIAMGPLLLKGVKAGEWRDLTSREVKLLRDAAFGVGPKSADERALLRSHAMKLGRNRQAMPTAPGTREDDAEKAGEGQLARPAATRPGRTASPAGRAGAKSDRKETPQRPKNKKASKGAGMNPDNRRQSGSSARSRFPLADRPPRLRT